MAVPPRTKQITVEVPEDAEWGIVLLAQLNQFILSVTSALQGALTRKQNFSSQRYVLEVTTGAAVIDSFPFRFNCTLPSAPEKVEIAQAQVITKGGSFSGARDASNWELTDGNQIQINEITGLNADTQYRLILFIS